MTETSIRYLRMLEHIPRQPQKKSVSELQKLLRTDGFPVDRRSVQRDLNKLSHVFAIADDGASPAGWYWLRDAKGLELPAMTPATALAFRILDEFARPLLPNNLRDFLGEHMDRARAILEEVSDRTPGFKDWSQLVAVKPRNQPLIPPGGDEAAHQVAYDALLERRRFQVRYSSRSAANPRSSYNVNPLGIVLRDNVLYMVCTLFDYSDIRVLAMHRMRGAALLDEPAWWPDGFDLHDYVASGTLDILEGPDIQLVADFEADATRHLQETPLSEDQELHQRRDGRVRVTATVQNTSQLRWWLLGFGESVEVRRPGSLRKQMATTAARLYERYIGEST